MRRRRHLVAVAGAATAVLLLAAGCSGRSGRKGDVHLGRPRRTTTTAAPAVTIAVPPPDLGAPTITEPASAPGLLGPDGRPYGAPLVFRSDVAVPDRLVFVLVAGSDARRGQDPRRANADSVHLVAVDPVKGHGTVVGFPRDAWVEVPGRGSGKLTSALAMGGPQLLAATVRHLTGLPVDYYVLTGFHGFQAMVDDLGGVDVLVERRMNDRTSGARFEKGWHHMGGGEALAYARNRNDVPLGDFSRSENQGRLMLAALAKLRSEVGDEGGLAAYLHQMRRHCVFDVPPHELLPLATLARRLDPARLFNVVVPGRVGTATGGQSVVYLGEPAARLFLDLRPDAVVDGSAASTAPAAPSPAQGSPTSSTSTSTTTAPGGLPRFTTTTSPAGSTSSTTPGSATTSTSVPVGNLLP